VKVVARKAGRGDAASALLHHPLPGVRVRKASSPRPIGREPDRQFDHRDEGHGGQPRDAGGEDPAARVDDPDRLPQRPQPVGVIEQVVQRAEQGFTDQLLVRSNSNVH
jgi:hypothetical protein